MKPQRMCSVCRERFDKDELLRIVKNQNGEVCIDKEQRLQGRGMYICKSDKCLAVAEKRRVIERAFSVSAQREVYETLLNMGE